MASGVGTHYNRSDSDAAVLADLLKDQGYDSEGDGYEARSIIAQLPMTLADDHVLILIRSNTGNPWIGDDGRLVD